MTKINLNLFCNDNGYSEINTQDRNGNPIKVQITPSEFVQGWTIKQPPFSNNVIKVRENQIFEAGLTYEAPGWANNDLKGEDENGKPTLIERNGRKMEKSNPAVGSVRKKLSYLNIVLQTKNDSTSFQGDSSEDKEPF